MKNKIVDNLNVSIYLQLLFADFEHGSLKVKFKDTKNIKMLSTTITERQKYTGEVKWKKDTHPGAREEPKQATYKASEIGQREVVGLYDIGARN